MSNNFTTKRFEGDPFFWSVGVELIRANVIDEKMQHFSFYGPPSRASLKRAARSRRNRNRPGCSLAKPSTRSASHTWSIWDFR
ncbi:hypothetical protein OESDEN_02363, partial [Oesophagostomum dentatum]